MLKLEQYIENEHFIIKDNGYKTPCYIWIRAIDYKGYGYATITYSNSLKLTVRVHKYLYEQKYGIVIDNLELDHKCNIRACINSDHLEKVTRSENAKRGFTRGTRKISGSILNHINTTHCPKGHEYNKENTYITKNNHRQCKICRDIRNKQRYIY